MLLTLLGVVFIVFNLWRRLTAMQATIVGLTERLAALEELSWAPEEDTPAIPTPPIATPAPTPVTPARTVFSDTTEPVPTAETTQPLDDDERWTQRDSLETRIGSRWLLYVGVIAIIVGVSYFEKLAIDNQWIGETARALQGGVIGLGLVEIGRRVVRRGYRTYGQVLAGCGVAVLYLSTYAAFNLYHLIGQPTAFALMSAVTMLAASLANTQRSQALALVAVGGGFATPFLLPSDQTSEIALFGYEAILIAGTAFLSRRRTWPSLNIVSYASTVLTVSAWAGNFYDSTKYLQTELFLTLFCALFVYILYETRRSTLRLVRDMRTMLWTAPVAYYAASLGILFPHSLALLVYLILLSLTGVIVGSRVTTWMRPAFWLGVGVPMLLWSATHGNRVWLVPGVTTWACLYMLHLAGLFHETFGPNRRFGAVDILLLHLSGLMTYAGVYLLIVPVHVGAGAPLAAGFAVVQAAAAWLSLKSSREEALHFAALGFTLLAIAIVQQFDGAWRTSAWTAEGAVVAFLGLRERREWLRVAGLFVFLLGLQWLITLQFAEPSVGQRVLLNERVAGGLFTIALTYLLTLAHQRYGAPESRRFECGVGLVLVQLLALAVASSEIVAYWALHTPPRFEPASQVLMACFAVGATTMWLGLRRAQEGIRTVAGVILGTSAFYLVSLQLEVAPQGYVVLLNGRAVAGIAAVVTFAALAVLHRRIGRHIADLTTNVAILTTGASLLLLSLLTSEIEAFWTAGSVDDVWSTARQGLQTIVWAGIGSFLVWQGLRNGRAWVRAIGGGLITTAVLYLLWIQFTTPSPLYVVVANGRVLAAVVVITLLYGLARLYRHADPVFEGQYPLVPALHVAANALTLTLLSGEIIAYWHIHDARAASTLAASNYLAKEMMLSITWAGYAMALIVVGLWKHYAPLRYFGMTVFVITIVKVFMIDLSELDRIYRVLSVIGLGITLLVTSYLYQRSRTDRLGSL